MRGYPSQVKGAGPPGVVGPHLRSELALGDEKKSCGVEPADGHVSLQGFESPSPHQLAMRCLKSPPSQIDHCRRWIVKFDPFIASIIPWWIQFNLVDDHVGRNLCLSSLC